jgi:hypothetical protein
MDKALKSKDVSIKQLEMRLDLHRGEMTAMKYARSDE